MGSTMSQANTTAAEQGITITPQNRQFFEAFSLFDQNGDGTISSDELGMVLRCLGQNPTDSELQDMVTNMDKDQSGYIDKREFVTWMSEQRSSTDIEVELMEAFTVFDQDGDGTFPVPALRHIMKELCRDLEEDEVEEMMMVADPDGDDKIIYEEFVKSMVTK